MKKNCLKQNLLSKIYKLNKKAFHQRLTKILYWVISFSLLSEHEISKKNLKKTASSLHFIA